MTETGSKVDIFNVGSIILTNERRQEETLDERADAQIQLFDQATPHIVSNSRSKVPQQDRNLFRLVLFLRAERRYISIPCKL